MFSANETIIEINKGLLITKGRYANSIKNICYLSENKDTKEMY